MDKKREYRAFCVMQKTEITEYEVYKKLAKRCKLQKNKKHLNQIAKEELGHYNLWKKHTKIDMRPSPLKVWWYVFLSTVFGLTFGASYPGPCCCLCDYWITRYGADRFILLGPGPISSSAENMLRNSIEQRYPKERPKQAGGIYHTQPNWSGLGPPHGVEGSRDDSSPTRNGP